ncbi:MAG: response regulator [Chloroflexi bacterium]|nr:response regulator [Chloroflexota bacterium]MCI0800980.1 response regulator [Chloroflexota bacterium]MCI0848044.1 response regulator [Chloroflexota bacterium]MCI0898880.1 response regulator [Chloroflexota bacterium]MCI0900736.1 response regulator [Chloroflexota bacterium]
MAKILVVEDEPSLRKLLQYQLSKIGHEIRVAGDGEQALALVKSERPDLVLLDVVLPVMGGFQVLRKLQEDKNTKSILVIMLSAKGQQHDIAAGLNQGVFDYITKPFNIPNLSARIDKALASIG